MITGIIMASGFSKRMGHNKLLHKVDGVRIIERVIRNCKGSSLDEIMLVYRDKEIGDIGKGYDIKTIYNPKAILGQSESMKLGIKAAGEYSEFMFLMGDQPFITKGLINQLINEHINNEQYIIVPYYNNKRGNPTIFPSRFREELLNVEGDKGGRDIINKYNFLVKRIDVADEKLGRDIDREEDLEP